MDRLQQLQQQRKKTCSKTYHGFSGKMSSLFDLKSARKNSFDRGYGEGNGHMKRQMNEQIAPADSTFGSRLPAEGNSFSMDFKRSSSSKVIGTPMKMLLAEEMSKEMELRRQSPSVIARLMGLDALPTKQPVNKQQKSSKSYCQRTRSVGFQEKYVTHEERSFTKRSKEQQEFKDVFEIMETPKVEKNNIHSVERELVSSKLSEAKMEFIRQKFMDAKRLSAARNLHQSLEFREAVDVLDSNKDLFLKFLQEPDSLFTKHLHDLQAVVSSPQSSDVRALKSLKAGKHDKSKLFLKSEGKMEGHMRLQKDITGSLQKQEHGCLSHNKHDFYSTHKLSKSQLEGNSETCLLPTRIVVLKPSHKTHDTTRSVSSLSSSGSSYSSHRKQREFRRSRSQESFPELRDQPKFVNNVDFVRHRPKVSSDIAKVITQQVRQTVSNDFNLSTSGLKGYSGDESSDSMSGNESLKDSEALVQSSRHFYERSSRCSPSSSYSAESSVSREAKKRLSERWKMTQKFQEVGFDSKCSSTLREMLALSDKERPLTTSGSQISEIGPCGRSSVNEVLERWDYPLSISSRDGWNDGSFRNRPRSRSLSTSFIDYRSPKTRSRQGSLDGDNCFMLKEVIMSPDKSIKDSDQKEASFPVNLGVSSKKSQSYRHKSEENDLTIREIHVNADEQKSRLANEYLSEQINIVPEPSIDIEELSFEPTARIALFNDGVSTLHDCDQNDVMKNLMKETTLNQQEPEQPSPVSVLEPPNEAELSTSECFESISAGLHGLRMQLQLLKFDSAETHTDGSDFISLSDEDLGEGCDNFMEDNSVTSGLYTHVEDRDFLFLLDMLIESGFHVADHEMLFATSYSLEQPVAPFVFENLEKKHGEQLAWPRWERRLLFDHINSLLVEILKPHMDLHPWVKPKWSRVGLGLGCEGLADQVWKLLASHGKEGLGDTAEKVMGRDVEWLELGDDIDVIGREIEISLLSELLEEVISGISSFADFAEQTGSSRGDMYRLLS
ncbi:hypothetical protein MRB53_011197 [Persea americana]|uniref:Uncharacterized protein n=1 Tax=Persea americana TaxID=3435 RepID=A0ACC2LU24_PERAE|nr:hypothetical protein MRB53_011197 [Persea americana]